MSYIIYTLYTLYYITLKCENSFSFVIDNYFILKYYKIFYCL